jgi:hypothetical protein
MSVQRDNAVVAENRHAGTTEWQQTYWQMGGDDALRSSVVEGYASRTSVAPGQSIDLHVSTGVPRSVLIEVYRLGYYDGLGGRLMATLGPFRTQHQFVPFPGEGHLRACAWPITCRLDVPRDWLSGVYLAKLTVQTAGREPAGPQSYIVFIVRDRRQADLLVQCSDTTWQAYNRWPARDSLYDDGTSLPGRWSYFYGLGAWASFDRPYAKYDQCYDAPFTVGSGTYLLFEFPLAYWLEREGYDVTYCSNIDTHADPRCAASCRTFISVAHDEYWTTEMFDHVRAARDGGTSLAFLAGNAIYWRIGLAPNAAGVPHRALTRLGHFGDENTLMGAHSTGPIVGAGDWRAAFGDGDHWLFAGTGMRQGEAVRGLVGWEYHADPAPIEGLQVVARGPVRAGGEPSEYTATLYRAPRGNWVFNAATIWWSEGLSSPPGHIPAMSPNGRTLGPDRRVQRITANLLERLVADAAQG